VIAEHEIIIGNTGGDRIAQKIAHALREWGNNAIILDINNKLFFLTEKEQKRKGRIFKLKLDSEGVFPITVSKIIRKATIYFELKNKNIKMASKNLDALFNYFLISNFKHPILIVLDGLQTLKKLHSLPRLIKEGSSKNIRLLIPIFVSNIEDLMHLLKKIGYDKSEIDMFLNNCKIIKMC